MLSLASIMLWTKCVICAKMFFPHKKLSVLKVVDRYARCKWKMLLAISVSRLLSMRCCFFCARSPLLEQCLISNFIIHKYTNKSWQTHGAHDIRKYIHAINEGWKRWIACICNIFRHHRTRAVVQSEIGVRFNSIQFDSKCIQSSSSGYVN